MFKDNLRLKDKIYRYEQKIVPLTNNVEKLLNFTNN